MRVRDKRTGVIYSLIRSYVLWNHIKLVLCDPGRRKNFLDDLEHYELVVD